MPRTVQVCVTSLGCAKNLVDTEIMLGSLADHGAGFTTDLDQANIHLINTCAFIDAARSESNAAIGDAMRWKRQRRNRKVIVAGCLAQRSAEKLKQRYPGIDMILGLDEVAQIGERLSAMYERMGGFRAFPAEDLPVYLYDVNTPRVVVTPKHYAYMKIAEGCNMRCSFCAIPTFRGLERSRSIESIAAEGQRLLDEGVRELILVSQNSSRYGLERKDGTNLAGLLRRLNDLEADEYWVRPLYLYPTSVTDELIAAFAECERVVPYVDMPLQHASDPVLKRMRRGIRKARLERLLETFREQVPGVTLRTTFLVGHPGENQEEFDELHQFVRDQRFDRFGVFTYSQEENTHAYPWTDFVSREVADERRGMLLATQQEIAREKNEALVGGQQRIIIDDLVADEESGGFYGVGRTQGDAPDADNSVRFSASTDLAEQSFCDVRITAAEPYDLYAEHSA